MSHHFTVIFEKEDEGGYHVFCPTLPGCHTQSETIPVRHLRRLVSSAFTPLLLRHLVHLVRF